MVAIVWCSVVVMCPSTSRVSFANTSWSMWHARPAVHPVLHSAVTVSHVCISSTAKAVAPVDQWHLFVLVSMLKPVLIAEHSGSSKVGRFGCVAVTGMIVVVV